VHSQECRSGYITKSGAVIGIEELEGTRRLRAALASVGISVTLDTALKAFRALRASTTSTTRLIEVRDD
jgi:hypothetical protein